MTETTPPAPKELAEWISWAEHADHALEAAEKRAKTAELDLALARSQLVYLWEMNHSCPCGARQESLNTHSHVFSCPTAKAIEEVYHD